MKTNFQSVFILLFCLFNIYSLKLYSQIDTIKWNSHYKLIWNDFQGKPIDNSPYGAISYCGIKYDITIDQTHFEYKVSCYFVKSLSWVRVFSNFGLLHEQGHFNIAEIFARKLRKAFANYHYNYNSINNDANKIFTDIIKERSKMDSLYDKETDFSRNKINQTRWLKKINLELNNLKTFEEKLGFTKYS